jgi:hypothetical protein
MTPVEFQETKSVMFNSNLKSDTRGKLLEFLKEAWNKQPPYVSHSGPKFCNFHGVDDFEQYKIVPAFSREIAFFLNGNTYTDEAFSIKTLDNETNETIIVQSFSANGYYFYEIFFM